MRSAWFLGLIFFASHGIAQVTCSAQQGLVLTTSPPRLGDPWSLALSGSSNAPGVLGFDLAPGPVLTPFGPVCLGLTPALQLSPIALDAFGGYTLSGFLPANPALNGFGLFIQAAVADPVQPSGIALSNSIHAVLRPPRLFFIDYGSSTPTGSTPGRWVAYDALSDVAGPIVQVPGPILNAAAIPTLGWIAMVLTDGTLIAFDAITGAVTLNIPLTTAGSAVTALVAIGSTLVIIEGAFPGPTLLHFVQLPLTSPPMTVTPPLPCYALVAPQGSPYVYATASGSDLVFPYLAGNATALPPISLGSGSGPYATGSVVLHGSMIYALLAKNGPWSTTFALNAIDTTTNTPLLTTPVVVPYYLSFPSDPLFRYGPGASGPALLLHDNSSIPSALVEISPQTLAVISAPIPIPAIVYDLEPCNGGTEWLLASASGAGGSTCGCGTPQTLYRMNPATHAVTEVGALPNGDGWPRVSVLPSGSVNKAYVSTRFGVVRFNTDPTTTIIPVSLPIVGAPPSLYSAGGLNVVID